PAICFVVGQRQVTGAGTHVKDRRRPSRRRQARGPPAPVVVDVAAEKMVEQIVTRRDVAEHRPNARLTLVEQGTGHELLPISGVGAAQPMRSFYERPSFRFPPFVTALPLRI